MSDVIRLASSVIDKLKQLRQLQDDMKHIETKNLMAELLNDVADIKIEAASLKEENLRLAEAVKTKSRADAFREILDFTNSVYLLTQDADRFKAGTAFCPTCLDVDGLVIALTEMQVAFAEFGKYKCNSCDKCY